MDVGVPEISGHHTVLGVGLGSIWGWLVQEMSVSPSPPGSELLGLMSYSPVQSSCLPGAWGGENAQGKWKELDSAWVRLGLHAFRGACCEHTGVRV